MKLQTPKAMKKIVMTYVFDGFADWEAAYAMTGVGKSNELKIKTIAVYKSPIRSMGGLTVIPDLDFLPDTDLRDIDDTNTALLILPGGGAWEEKTQHRIVPLIQHCYYKGIPIAAIGGATIVLADMGILNSNEHTSNDSRYLEAFSPHYRGEMFYQESGSVNAGNVITAADTAAVEFADHIFDVLGIGCNPEVAGWFGYFKNKPVTLNQFSSGLFAG